MDAAEFIVRIIDKATAPARRISAAFAGIDKAMAPVTGNKAFKALDKAGTKLWDFGKTASLVGGVVAVGLAGAFTKASLDAAMFSENTQLAFTRLTGSASMGAEAFEAVRRNTAELGLDLHDAADGFRKLLAAQFSLKESEQLVRMSSDLSAIGIHGEEAKRVLMAITQIKAKGRVQQEELLQLAEAGISLELVMGQLQKTLGKTPDEVRKLQEAGKVSGDIGIEAVKAAVKQKLHITEFGQARKAFVETNLSGMIEALKAQGQLLFLKLGDSIKGAADAMKPLVQDTADWVRNLNTSTITEVVTSVLTTLRALIPLGREFFVGFLQGFGALSNGLRLDIDASSIKAAGDAGRSLAEALGTLLTIGKMVGSMFLWFTTSPVGKFVAVMALATIGVVKVMGAVAAVSGFIAAAAPGIAWIAGLFTFAKLVLIGFLATFGALPLVIGAAVAGAIALVITFWDEIDAFFGGIPQKMFDVGVKILSALGSGLLAALQMVTGPAWKAGTMAVQAVKDAIGMHSPPQAFVDIGFASSEAIGLGMDKGAPALESASARAMAAPAMSGAEAGRISGGGGPVSVSVQIAIDGSGDPKATADAVSTALETRLAMFFESLTSPSPVPA